MRGAASDATKFAVDDIVEQVHTDTYAELEAVFTEAAAAADEILANDARAAASEAVRVSSGEGLGLPSPPRAAQTRLELDRSEMSGSYQWLSFLVDSAAIETLLSMASGFCPVADSRTARWWPTELPGGGQQSCPQFSWSVASPPFRRWLG